MEVVHYVTGIGSFSLLGWAFIHERRVSRLEGIVKMMLRGK